MGISYKNFWSFNPDEAVVTGILRNFFKKEVGVFMPLDAQFKNIDLILINLKNRKSATLQVKGSRAYEPSKKELKLYGQSGSGGWFFINKEIIHRSNADFFIFLVYVILEKEKDGRRYIEPHTITIPTKKLKELCFEYKKPHPDNYSFYFRIHPRENRAFDWRDKEYDVSEYLDKKGFEGMVDTND